MSLLFKFHLNIYWNVLLYDNIWDRKRYSYQVYQPNNHTVCINELYISRMCNASMHLVSVALRSCLLLSWKHTRGYWIYRYDIPWAPINYIPFYGGADYHDYHHYVGGQNQSNFTSVFTYCDYIYGTDKVTIRDLWLH